eukprot:9059219-Lingulodinium_polyedra.AAC.1
MALDILERVDLPPGPVTIVGDNLVVVRYCADTGRLRSHAAHGVLDSALGRAACKRRPIAWLAVRR